MLNKLYSPEQLTHKLLQCPTCELEGKRITLGEDRGTALVILRRILDFGTKRGEFTIIRGSNFEVECPNCHEIVYKKEEPKVNITYTEMRGTFAI